jgi:hypothetical protein
MSAPDRPHSWACRCQERQRTCRLQRAIQDLHETPVTLGWVHFLLSQTGGNADEAYELALVSWELAKRRAGILAQQPGRHLLAPCWQCMHACCTRPPLCMYRRGHRHSQPRCMAARPAGLWAPGAHNSPSICSLSSAHSRPGTRHSAAKGAAPKASATPATAPPGPAAPGPLLFHAAAGLRNRAGSAWRRRGV